MRKRIDNRTRRLAIGLFLAGALAAIAPAARGAGEVGSMAADFSIGNLVTPGPASATLSDYRGSVVCIAFFAFW